MNQNPKERNENDWLKKVVAFLYGVGCIMTLALFILFLFHQDVALPWENGAALMLPEPLYERAGIWLAMGSVPMVIVSILFYWQGGFAGIKHRISRFVTVFLPAGVCLCFLVFWLATFAVGVLNGIFHWNGQESDIAAALELADPDGDWDSSGQTSVQLVKKIDTHGGFHNDGLTYMVLKLEDPGEEYLKAIEQNPDWKRLPLSANLNALLYGEIMKKEGTEVHRGPYITDPESGETCFPPVAKGYYYFEDRHFQSADSKDDTEILGRGSFNLTIALYDTDAHVLYYCRFDT